LTTALVVETFRQTSPGWQLFAVVHVVPSAAVPAAAQPRVLPLR
jgi:hypothetical protein